MDKMNVVSGTVVVVATTIFAYALWSVYKGMSNSTVVESNNE